MRGIKFGLAMAVAAAALTMAVGAGSAAASTTAFCDVDSSPLQCPGVNTFPSFQHFEVRGEAAFSSLTSCEFVYEFEVPSGRATSPSLTKLRYWEFFNCTGGHSVAAPGLPAQFFFTTSGSGPNGVGEYVPWTAEPFEIDGNCVYEAAAIPQVVSGGSVITASGVVLNLASGTFCLNTLKLLTVGEPTPSFYLTN